MVAILANMICVWAVGGTRGRGKENHFNRQSMVDCMNRRNWTRGDSRLHLQLARATVCFGIICLAVANDEALIGALGPCPVGVDQANGREVTDYSYFLTDPKTTCRGKRCAKGEGGIVSARCRDIANRWTNWRNGRRRDLLLGCAALPRLPLRPPKPPLTTPSPQWRRQRSDYMKKASRNGLFGYAGLANTLAW